MKKKTDTSDIQTQAESALTRMRAARDQFEAAEKARDERAATVHATPPGGWAEKSTEAIIAALNRDLELNALSQTCLKAKDELLRTTAEAAPKIDALEDAEGDEIFTACSDKELAADCETFNAEEARLHEALAAVAERRDARRRLFDEATEQLTARRESQGLPPPERALPPRISTEEFRVLRHEEGQLRDRLAIHIRVKKEADAARKSALEQHEQRKAYQAARDRQLAEEWRAKCEAERKERDDLIAAQQASEKYGDVMGADASPSSPRLRSL